MSGNNTNSNGNSGSRANNRDLLMLSLARFFTQKGNINKVLPVITGKSDISLRLIDWFVTNYAKKHNIIITQQVQHNVIHFNVYLSYRSQLKAYSKHQFDPFRRRDRITFFYEKHASVETTIGQLNFFRWIIENDILSYIMENAKAIEADMLRAQRLTSHSDPGDPKGQSKKETAGQKEQVAVATATERRRKRHELSKSALKNVNKLPGTRLLKFD